MNCSEIATLVSSDAFENNSSFIEPKIETTQESKITCSEEAVKCELVGYDSLPGYLKDNEFILRYYRCEWPMKQTLLSIFSIHNETLNIWTHLIGFFVFLALTICTARMIKHDNPSVSLNQSLPEGPMLCSPDSLTGSSSACNYSDYDIIDAFNYQVNLTSNATDAYSVPTISTQPLPRWPFFTFLCGAMTCLLASSACHLLSCHSQRCSYIMLRLDYVGISVLIVTSFYPLVYYSFMCHPFFCTLYNVFITVFGIAIAAVSLLPVFQTSKFRLVRSALFFSMGVSAVVPILHKLVAFQLQREAVVTAAYELAMGVIYVVGLVIYAARVPERWMPGKCDLAGHSHQLFHVCVVAGAYTHYLAGLVYLEWRDVQRC